MPRTLLSIEDKTDTLSRENLRANRPDFVVLHSTLSYPTFDDVLRLHKSYGWNGVGYHIFVDKKGIVSQARPTNVEGAHAFGFNTKSIGVCFYAENGLEDERADTVRRIVDDLKKLHNKPNVISHTLAQVMYINQRLREESLDVQFPETQDIVNWDVFEQVRTEMDKYAGTLSTSNYGPVKKLIKEFKNCPGENFNKIRRGISDG